MKKLKVIALIAGPGAGKTTLLSGLVNLMKIEGHKVEGAREKARDYIYQGRADRFVHDQLHIFGQQRDEIRTFIDPSTQEPVVDYVVTDSPLLLQLAYAPPNYLNGAFDKLVHEVIKEFEYIYVFVQRPEHGWDDDRGRIHDLEESKRVDERVRSYLNALHGVPIIGVHAHDRAQYDLYAKLLDCGFVKPAPRRKYVSSPT